MTAVLTLPPPYGYDAWESVWIKLKVEDDTKFDYSRLECILQSFSCYPPAIPKIYNCLVSSGEYSCILAASWFENQRVRCQNTFRRHGIKLIVTKVVRMGTTDPFSDLLQEPLYFKPTSQNNLYAMAYN